MSDHYASTKDEAEPAPSPRAMKWAADLAHYRKLVEAGVDRAGIRERMGRSSLEALERATGLRARVDRGAGECREAVAPAGFECDARGGRRGQ